MAILLIPVVLASSAVLPIPVLAIPVVLAASTRRPMAVLDMIPPLHLPIVSQLTLISQSTSSLANGLATQIPTLPSSRIRIASTAHVHDVVLNTSSVERFAAECPIAVSALIDATSIPGAVRLVSLEVKTIPPTVLPQRRALRLLRRFS